MRILWITIRTLGRHKAFVSLASASIAVGLGVCLALLAVLDALLWRPLDTRDPYELVDIATRLADGRREGLSIEAAARLTRDSPLFSDSVAWSEGAAVVDFGGETARGTVLAATSNLFEFLATPPGVGRLLSPSDGGLEDIGSPSDALVLGHSFWRRAFGGNPAIIGQIVNVKGMPMRVVGVAPLNFRGLSAVSEPDMIVSIAAFAALSGPDAVRMRDPQLHWLTVTARLSSGVTIEAAERYLRARWDADTVLGVPSPQARRVEVSGVANGYANSARGTYTRILYTSLSVAVLAVLVAAVNTGGLLLARSASRTAEHRTKLAIGASFGTIVRDTLLEVCVVIMVSLVLAWAIGMGAIRVLWLWIATTVPTISQLTTLTSWRTFSLMVALALGALITASVPPLWSLARQRRLLRTSGVSTREPSVGRSVRVIIALQLALATPALAVAVLLLDSLRQSVSVEPGYRYGGLTVASLAPKGGHYRGVDADGYLADLLTALRTVPGVEGAALAQFAPGSGASPTRSVSAADAEVDALAAQVSDGFFEVLGLPIIEGRPILPSDSSGSERVGLVSASLGRALFAGVSPLGRRMTVSQGRQSVEVRIVGVVADANLYDARNANLRTVYLATRQAGPSALYNVALIRSNLPFEAIGAPLRTAVSSIGVDDVTSVRTVEEMIHAGLQRDYLLASTAGGVAMLVLVLAVLGIYGLSSYTTSLRAGELRVRAALGASPNRLWVEASYRIWTAALAGAAAGIPLVIVSARSLSPVLYGETINVILLGGTVASLLAVVAVVATGPSAGTVWRRPLSSSMRIVD